MPKDHPPRGSTKVPAGLTYGHLRVRASTGTPFKTRTRASANLQKLRFTTAPVA